MNYPHPYLAKEGWPFIAMAFMLAVFASFFLGTVLALLCWVALVLVTQFFRDPPRPVPSEAGAVLSPADGRVVRIERGHDPYGDREALVISVFMNVFDGHSQRMAVDGTVRRVQYVPGQFLHAELDKSSELNERNAVVIDTPAGHRVTLVQVAGLVARRVLCYLDEGAKVSRGQRYGFIRFGSRVDVYLPLEASPRVAPGDRVQATSTVLATLV